MDYFIIALSAIFVNNIVLSQFLGICPFLGVSSKVETALGMGGAVFFVLTLATLVTNVLYHFVLIPLGIEFMRTVLFILTIASLVQMVEMVLKKTAPSLYQALGIFLPLITTNCAVLGVAILAIQKDYTLVASLVFAASHAVGFTMAIVIFAGIREHFEICNIPKGMKGVPISLLVAGLISMSFMGFSGIF